MKAALLLAAASAAFGLLGSGARAGVERVVARTLARLAASTEYGSLRLLVERALTSLLAWIGGATPRRLVVVGGIALAYAAMLTAEGIGLLRDRPWAEVVSVVVTASLIPLEVRELALRFTAVRLTVLVLNVLAVLYLTQRLLTRRAREASGF